jgi:hypothetical protein
MLLQRRPGMVRVNIHNTGKIPWLNILGPKYDVSISISIFRLLKRDPRIIVRTIEEDEALGFKIPDSQTEEIKKEVVKETVETTAVAEPTNERVIIEDSVKITPIVKNVDVEDALLDAEIEKRINELPDQDAFKITMDQEESKIVNLKKYSNKQLDKMTREQMFQVLFDRGHTAEEDPMKPKYHDTKPMLIKKVKDTQKFM